MHGGRDAFLREEEQNEIALRSVSFAPKNLGTGALILIPWLYMS